MRIFSITKSQMRVNSYFNLFDKYGVDKGNDQLFQYFFRFSCNRRIRVRLSFSFLDKEEGRLWKSRLDHVLHLPFLKAGQEENFLATNPFRERL